MVNFYRLTLAFVLLLVGLPAFADGGPFPATPGQFNTDTCNTSTQPTGFVPPGETWQWQCRPAANGSQTCGYLNVGYDIFMGRCSIFKGPDTCPAGANKSSGSDGESVCTCTSGLRPFDGQCVAAPVCPEGQVDQGGACVPVACKANETRVNGVCVPEPPCPAGESRVNGKCVPFKCPTQGTASDQWYDLEGPGKSATCLFNSQDKTYCTMTITPAVVAYQNGKPSYYGGYGVYTGGTCGPSEPGKPTPVDPAKPNGDPNDGTKPPPKGDPKPGDKPGGAGGGPGNNPTPPNTDGKCPEGTYKSGSNCYQKDPPKKPPDEDGKCPAGYIKSGSDCLPLMPKPNDSDGDGKDDDDKDKSTFGGQCEAVQCDGDAIQCAIARDQYKRSCELMEKESEESNLYKTGKGKTGNQTGNLPGNETISLTGRIDSTDALGAGSAGVSDVNVTVWGKAITLPFSMINPYLEYLGYILVGVSLLLAVRIVGRG